MLAYHFWRNIPDIIYDGIIDEEILLIDGNVVEDKRICIQNNENASFVNLDAKNDFNDMSTDLSPHDCSHSLIKAVAYPFTNDF